MIYNPLINPAAHDKLDSHIAFLANVSESASFRLLDEFEDNLAELSTNPHIYPRYEHRSNQNLRNKLFYHGRFRIVYEVILNDVYILDIQDCRQDTDKNLI